MSDEYKKALLQVAVKLTKEQEKMCEGKERCAGCAWFEGMIANLDADIPPKSGTNLWEKI